MHDLIRSIALVPAADFGICMDRHATGPGGVA